MNETDISLKSSARHDKNRLIAAFSIIWLLSAGAGLCLVSAV